MEMNVSKTEIHANGTAPEDEFLTPRGSEFLTYKKNQGALSRAINTSGYISLHTTKPRACFTCSNSQSGVPESFCPAFPPTSYAK